MGHLEGREEKHLGAQGDTAVFATRPSVDRPELGILPSGETCVDTNLAPDSGVPGVGLSFKG
jgi:hypothetical protein